MAEIVLENIYKEFPPRPGAASEAIAVLHSINLTVKDGEFMVLVGPSGCGKSTLLRLVAGLETLTKGSIWVGERPIDNLPPKERDIAMVFQNYALYPHLSVYDNLAFGLRRMGRGSASSPTSETGKVGDKSLPDWAEDFLVTATRPLPKGLRYFSAKEKAVDERVRQVAKLLQIELLLSRLPKQLSGGQKQRVALGRAIARNPQVFLMDEPLSNLDAQLRGETRSQIVELQGKLGITTIYVTHDQTEAMTMGDRIAVMRGGEIQQVASPLEIYNCPANRFVAEFIGSPPMNFLPVSVRSPLLVTRDRFRLTLPEAWEGLLKPYDGKLLWLGIRPEHLNLSPPAPKNLQVQVDSVEALGHETILHTHLAGDIHSPLQVRISPNYSIKVGDLIWLSLALDKIYLFDTDKEKKEKAIGYC